MKKCLQMKNWLLGHIFLNVVFYHRFGGGDTRDIAEPTYKTVNKLLYKNTTAYKTFNLPTRLSTNYYTKTRPHTRLSTYQLGFQPKNYTKNIRYKRKYIGKYRKSPKQLIIYIYIYIIPIYIPIYPLYISGLPIDPYISPIYPYL